MSFTTPLDVRVTQGERGGQGLAELLTPFAYDVGRLGSGDRIVVPAGFVTDFASVPWWARGLFAPFDRAAKAAVLHDWLWSRGSPRHAAVFAEALAVLRVPAWKRAVMAAAVRWRGLPT